MRTAAAVLLSLGGWILFAQTPPAFDVASVRQSARTLGRDFNNQVSITPAGITGRNVTLKYLIGEAYGVQPFQVTGGPAWLDTAEYDLEAKASGPAPRPQVDRMLESLLGERFHLAVHKELRKMRVYRLVVDQGGPKIRPVEGTPGTVGGLDDFARFLSVQLSISIQEDPSRPGMATVAPIPVVNRTGLTGTYQMPSLARSEPGADMLVLWQRVLREQLGLKLENARDQVETIVVDHAERVPAAN